jgi:ribonucleoside-triphosphate reductase
MSPTYSICKNHGYVVGEAFTCPTCNEETEVYSRITGYYRPVKNWNDGKAQEFRERRVYQVSEEGEEGEKYNAGEEDAGLEKDRTILFTTKTCPNCITVIDSLEGANISYEKVDAGENIELARKYGVMQAPTLVVINGEGVEKMANASNIKAYVDGNCVGQPLGAI